MTTVSWIVLGLLAWFAVSVAIGLLIGGAVRNRDRQVPDDPEEMQ